MRDQICGRTRRIEEHPDLLEDGPDLIALYMHAIARGIRINLLTETVTRVPTAGLLKEGGGGLKY
jgi:hypothetical protein